MSTKMLAFFGGALCLITAALWFFFGFSPMQEAATEANDRADQIETNQIPKLTREKRELEAVQASADEYHAIVDAYHTLVPTDDAAISQWLRQVASTVGEHGGDIARVEQSPPSRSVMVGPDGEELPEELAASSVAFEFDATYGQTVSIFEALQNPAVSPRGFSVSDVTIEPVNADVANRNATFTVTVTGQMYLEAAPLAEVGEEGGGAVDPADEATDGATDGATEAATEDS